MPQIQHTPISDNCHLFLWQITEETKDLLALINLSDTERDQLESFGSPSRKKEFLVSRIIVQKHLDSRVHITHNQEGKPELQNSDYDISISHTKDLVGVMLGKNSDIALDIEYLSPRVERVFTRFLSDKEQALISSKDRILHLYQHWCAKECLIKLMGKKDLHLTKELYVHPFLPHHKTFTATILRNGKSFKMHQQLTSNYLMVYCCQHKSVNVQAPQ